MPLNESNTLYKSLKYLLFITFYIAVLSQYVNGIDGCDKPTGCFSEQIYLQQLWADNGFRQFAVSNEIAGTKMSVAVRYSENLNNLIHWRQFGEGDYVLGFEPANTTINGRTTERANEHVVILTAQEAVKYTVIFDFSVL